MKNSEKQSANRTQDEDKQNKKHNVTLKKIIKNIL
jgi:hypothetical protein